MQAHGCRGHALAGRGGPDHHGGARERARGGRGRQAREAALPRRDRAGRPQTRQARGRKARPPRPAALPRDPAAAPAGAGGDAARPGRGRGRGPPAGARGRSWGAGPAREGGRPPAAPSGCSRSRSTAGTARAGAARAAQAPQSTTTFAPSDGITGDASFGVEQATGADSGFTATAAVNVSATRAGVAKLSSAAADKLPPGVKSATGRLDVSFQDRAAACPGANGKRPAR